MLDRLLLKTWPCCKVKIILIEASLALLTKRVSRDAEHENTRVPDPYMNEEDMVIRHFNDAQCLWHSS